MKAPDDPQTMQLARIRRLLEPLLFSGLFLALLMPVVIIGEGLPFGWNGRFLLVMVPVIVVESRVSQALYRRTRTSGFELGIRISAELLMLMLFSLLLSYLWRGLPTLLRDAQRWIAYPPSFLDLYSYSTLVVVPTVWMFSSALRNALVIVTDEIERVEDRLYFDRFISTFLIWGGIWLVALAGFILQAPEFIDEFNSALSGRLQWAVVGYAALAILLLGYRQFLKRRLQWTSEALRLPERLARRWIAWGLIVVLGVAVLALVLPAGYRMGPGALFQVVFELLFVVVSIVTIIVFLIVSVFTGLLAFLFGNRSPAEILPSPDEIPAPPPAPAPFVVPDWWLTLRQALLVVAVIAVVAIVLRVYLQDRHLLAPRLRALLSWLEQQGARLLAWWQVLLARGRLGLQRLRAARLPDITLPDTTRPLWQVWRARTIRGRIRRYYLMLLQRADAAGIARKPPQTPDEYAGVLGDALTDQRPAVDALTGQFVRARYTRDDLADDDLQQAREAWQTLRDPLRQRTTSRGEPPGDPES